MHSKPTSPARSRRCRPCSPPRTLCSRLLHPPPTGGSGYNITTGTYGYGGGNGPYGGGAYGRGYGDGSYGGGAYGYGGSNGGYSSGAYSGPYDHGGHGGASYEAVPVGQSPGGGGGYDIPSRPPVAPDRGYHRAIQQAGDGGDGVAFATEDGGHEDEEYFGDPFSSVFGGPESGHGPTAYVLQLPTSGRSGGTGCDIPRSPPQYSGSNNGYGTNGGPQQQHAPRPFCGFGWEQRGACRNGLPVNGLVNSIAQGQAQRDVEMDCHGGPVSQVSGPPETTASLARGGPLYRHVTSDGCNHLAGPSYRQPPLSRTWHLRSGSN